MTNITESAPPEVNTQRISDRGFIKQLNEIRALKQFLFEEKVNFNPDQLSSIDLEGLNNLEYSPYGGGRSPTREEWKLLDKKFSALTAYLNEDLRPKIRIRQLGRYFGLIPLIFLFVVAISTIAYALYPFILTRDTLAWYAIFYTTMAIWTIAQGALGACAYLGTRVTLKKNQGISDSDILGDLVDITDVNVLRMRIILGSLFAFVIGMPISLQSLNNISKLMYDSTGNPTASDFVFILVPFLLGFSTNLVLAILGRCVASIQTFFGIPGSRS
jgi:hypothetical protein